MDEIQARAEGTFPRFVMENRRLYFKLFDPKTGEDRVWCEVSFRRAMIMLMDLTKAICLMAP
jgi:hypothetical protein